MPKVFPIKSNSSILQKNDLYLHVFILPPPRSAVGFGEASVFLIPESLRFMMSQ